MRQRLGGFVCGRFVGQQLVHSLAASVSILSCLAVLDSVASWNISMECTGGERGVEVICSLDTLGSDDRDCRWHLVGSDTEVLSLSLRTHSVSLARRRKRQIL